MADILDKTLLEKRNTNTELWQKVPTWARKIYVFQFKKGVHTFLKVGVTDYMEAYDRIIANHAIFKQGKEEAWVKTTMFEYFDEIKIMTSAMLPQEKANKLEEIILLAWGVQDLNLPKMNGMSEIRQYTLPRLKQARAIIEESRYKKLN